MSTNSTPGFISMPSPHSVPETIQRLCALLKSKGVQIERDIHWPKGGRSLYFRDPAGNSIEFASPLVWGMREE